MNGKKLTTREFIQRARKTHGNKYDYSKTVYVSTKKSVVIICRKHGQFIQNANDHMRRCGCPTCWEENHCYRTDRFINKARKVHEDRYNYRDVRYKTSTEKVKIICCEHGPFWQAAVTHLRGSGCTSCKIAVTAKTARERFAKERGKLLPFERLKKRVQRLGIDSKEEYSIAFKTIHGACADPSRTYSNIGWMCWSDFLGTSRQQSRVAVSGRVCPSVGAAYVESFLVMLGIPFAPEEWYGPYRADWRIKNTTLAEYFGYSGGRYNQKTSAKIAYCKAHGLSLVAVYPEDLKVPGRLFELFKGFIPKTELLRVAA